MFFKYNLSLFIMTEFWQKSDNSYAKFEWLRLQDNAHYFLWQEKCCSELITWPNEKENAWF